MTVHSIERSFRGELLTCLPGDHSHFPCVCHALIFAPSFTELNLFHRGYKTIAGVWACELPQPWQQDRRAVEGEALQGELRCCQNYQWHSACAYTIYTVQNHSFLSFKKVIVIFQKENIQGLFWFLCVVCWNIRAKIKGTEVQCGLKSGWLGTWRGGIVHGGGREWGERWRVGYLRVRIIQERSRKGENKMRREQNNSGRGCEGRGKLCIG